MPALFYDPSLTPFESAFGRGRLFVVELFVHHGAAHQGQSIGTDARYREAQHLLDVAALGEALRQGLAEAVDLLLGEVEAGGDGFSSHVFKASCPLERG